MKKYLNYGFIVLGLLAFTSCEKCRTCTSSVTIGSANTADKTHEFCAKKKDLDEWEDATRTAEESAAKGLGGTLNWSCVDE